MRQITCDVAVIGAGTAGLAAHDAALRAGAATVLIEAGPGGTTCARVGCMPSKLLIAAADAAAAARRLPAFGVSARGQILVDGVAVMARVRRERDRFVAGVLDDVAHIPAETRLAGQARFLSPTRLAVGADLEVEAGRIVIATGSRPAIPDAVAGLGGLLLTNETVFELPTLPGSLAVVGAGALGIELALAFVRLGVRVAVFDKAAAIGGLRDPEVAKAARTILGYELDLKLEGEFEAVASERGAAFTWRTPEGRNGTATFERVLVAAGRPPNLDGLDLARAGLALDDRGVPLFDPATRQCGTSAIFIAGDADAERPILHEAAREGRIAGRNAARFPQIEPQAPGAALAVVFTDPEIAIVGGGFPATEGEDVAIGAVDLAHSGRARVLGRNAGCLRVYARRRDGTILGGEMIGPQAEHLGHLLAWAVQLGLKAGDVLALPHYHPTLEESLRAAIRKLCVELKTHPEGSAAMEFGPAC